MLVSFALVSGSSVQGGKNIDVGATCKLRVLMSWLKRGEKVIYHVAIWRERAPRLRVYLRLSALLRASLLK